MILNSEDNEEGEFTPDGIRVIPMNSRSSTVKSLKTREDNSLSGIEWELRVLEGSDHRDTRWGKRGQKCAKRK